MNELKGRIIPTRVGKTTTQSWSKLEYTDHPHPCGENRLTASKTKT